MAVLSNWMAEARHLEGAGDLQAAVAIYRKALANQEETAGFADLSLYNGLGDLYLRAGKKSDALQAYEGAAQHCEDQQLYANGIALCKKILRNAPDHADAYRRAARLSALSGLEAEARLHHGRYRKQLIEEGRGAEALDALQEIVEIMADEESSVELAEAFAERGEADRALELLRAVKSRRQDEGRAVVILVRTIQELQQRGETDSPSGPAPEPTPLASTPVEEVPVEEVPAEEVSVEEVPVESFSELDTSAGYSLLPDVQPELAIETEPAIDTEPTIEVEPVFAAEPVVEVEAVLEPTPIVESEPVMEAEPVAAAAPKYTSILEELDNEFSDEPDAPLDDPWESGSVSDPSLGAFGSEVETQVEADAQVAVDPIFDPTPAAQTERSEPSRIEENTAVVLESSFVEAAGDPMALLLARLNVIMAEAEGPGCFPQALEVIDEMLTIEPGRFELLSRKLHYAFAIRDEAATISAYLALGESLDHHLASFAVRTLSSSNAAGVVTAAVQVEEVPGAAPGS